MNDMIDGRVYTNLDKTLLLTISKDDLSAYLTIIDNGNMVDEEEISSLLSSSGIINGLEVATEFNIENKITKEIGKPFLIASASDQRGKLEILYNFNPESCINIEKRYEMNDLVQFEKVIKNQLLAEIPISDEQNAGVDIFGNEVSMEQKPQINVEDILGDHVYFLAEKNQILSSEAGYPYLDHENKICVKSSFLSQDIHNVVKTIYGNTTFDGVISNSNLEIFGDLWVKGNIRNCDNGGILVHGNVILDYIEDSKLVASGKITINKNSRNSLIFANEAIEAGEFSSISGGITQSGKSVEVFSIGSPIGILTEVEITIAPFTKEQIRITRNKLIQARDETEVDETLISSLAVKLRELQSKFNNEIDNLHDNASLQIAIKEKAYPNSKIRILKDTIEIVKEKDNIEISLNESGLKINEVDKL